jgi:hypothetical protein
MVSFSPAAKIISLNTIYHLVFAMQNNNVICKGKGKAIPLQAWTGPEGSRRPDFKTIGT